jgi:AcrR family transcriptional regulator
MYRMAGPVKRRSAKTRPYDASRRQEQARRTRSRVLEIAHRRFLEDGYVATTMNAIATEADVSVETVYKAFANKAGILKAIFDVAIAGDDEPVPLQERAMVGRVQAEPDGRRKLAIYGEAYAGRARRAVPVQLVARDAAASDAGAADVWRQLNDERLTGMTAFADHLHDSNVLREGITRVDARDVLWLFTAPHNFELLVLERGWSVDSFGRWITQQLIAALL